MAFEQSFVDPILQFDTDGAVSISKQKKSESSAPTMGLENATGCFDCNICFESAHDPVVTLCGHLYCWPCIYKWLHIQDTSLESEEQPQCPVCKAHISNTSLVPLYGRGSSSSDYESKKLELDFSIPQRPPALSMNTPLPNSRPHQQLPPNALHQPPPLFHHQQYFPQAFGSYASIGPSSFGGTAVTSFFSPTVGIFGEMFFARMFGSTDTTVFAYPSVSAAGGPRMRRQEMQVEKSLNRLSIFLLCCLILCLLLF
nr:E3 ubiquitin-protein ligase RMA3-like [Ipomoea batatas]